MDFYFMLSNLFILGFFASGESWWFPRLRPGNVGGVSPSGVAPLISRWLVDVTPGCKKQAYAKVASLPNDVSSGSLRHSAINIMAASGVMIESIVAMSGHFLTSVSAVFEYLNITVTSTVIGMMVLTGWKIPTYTTWIKSPPTPTLKALSSGGGVTVEKIDFLMDTV